MSVKRTTIIDDDGVIVDTKDYKYTIFDPEKGYLFRNKAGYIKGYQNIKLSKVIDNRADYTNMHLVAENLYKDTNMIYVKRNRKYYPASIQDISDMTGLSDRYAREFMQRMIMQGIIAKVIVNTNETAEIQYYVNPLYFNTNKYLSPMLYMLFREQLNEYLPPWVIRKYNE